MLRLRSFLVILALLPATIARAIPPDTAFPLVTRHVGLDVKIDFEKAALSGVMRLEVENVSDLPVKEVQLNLNRLMQFEKASDDRGGLRLDQRVVTFDDRPLLQVNHARVTLRKPLAPRGSTTIDVTYGGHLVGYPETGSLYIRDTIDPSFTILRADAYAFPVAGSTNAKLNRARSAPGFTFDVRVTVPSTHTVATGGHLEGTTAAGDRTTWHYRSGVAVPFLNIAVAKYRTIDAGGIRVFHFAEDAAGAAIVLQKAGAAIALLTRWFGPLQHEPEFTLIEIPDGWGSQADLNAGVIQTASAFRDASAMQEVYHEISHFWNVPDADVPSSRWNEGLASYLQVRMAAELDATNELDRRADRVAARLVKMAASDKRLASVPFARYGSEQMTDYSYPVGFLMLVELQKRVGPDGVLRAVHDYYQSYKTTGAGFEAFIASASASAGTDLRPFFKDWVETTTWLERLRSAAPATQ